MSELIKRDKIERYLSELIKCPKSCKESFLENYLKGGGHELKRKFWSVKSSSRLCFDLYRDIASLDSVAEFQFEKNLPGLGSGGSGPYMDVYIETNSEIIFIENKFSEPCKFQDYKNCLSKGYWADEPYGRRNMSLAMRYYGYSDNKLGIEFKNFIEKIYEELRKKEHTQDEWFDVKQEICHILGILFFLFKYPKKQTKKISFYNFYWKFNDDKSEYADTFVEQAKNLVKCVMPNTEFNYETHSIQEFFWQNNVNILGFDFENIRTRIKHYENISKGRTRKEMQKLKYEDTASL